MSARVYKYPVPLLDRFTLPLHAGACVLDVQIQRDCPQMWVLVDPTRAPVLKQFIITGTGHELSDDDQDHRHVGTFQMGGGSLVFHVFEIRGNIPDAARIGRLSCIPGRP